MITKFLLIGSGAFIGAVIRYTLMLLIKCGNFPLALLIINALGSFFIGIMSIIFKNNVYIYTFIATGILGGFTSFSSFSLDTISMLENGKILLAGLNIFSSIFICLLFCFLGKQLGNIILK